VGLGLVLAAVAVALLLPASQAAFRANLGALSQTRAELAAFHWPETPLQDVLRRPGGVALAQAEGRFRAALALDPANVTANRRLGQIALANEDFTTARSYLEAAYRAAPGQRATRQLLGELEALEGDPAGAAALWAGIDLGAGQLQGREWWYGYLGQPQRADALRQAEELLVR
jgi:predicted Zn-dependent protease